MIKYFKPSIFVLSTIPFIVITYKIFFNKLGPEPVKEITHFSNIRLKFILRASKTVISTK